MREKEGRSISEEHANFRAEQSKIISLEAFRQKRGESGEKPVDPLERIPFEGFSRTQEANVKNQIRITRLPVENVTSVKKRPPVKGQESMIGSFHPIKGELILYGPERIPPQGQQATIIHELTHASSPFNPKNEEIYGSPEALKQTQEFVTAVVRQTAVTGKYLNGYHAYLFKQLERGEIDQRRLLEETHAIMVEERFKNPAHLAQVDEAQQKALERKGIKGGVRLVSQQTNEGVALSGIDATVMRLTKIGTYEDLNKHFQNVRNSITPENNKSITQFPQPLAQAA